MSNMDDFERLSVAFLNVLLEAFPQTTNVELSDIESDASDHAVEVGTKPWKYLLLPHDEITESKRLSDYLRFEVKR